MAIRMNEKSDGTVLEVEARGKLTHADFQEFTPEFDRCVGRHGKLRVLFNMVDFHGWEPSALWDEIKFDLKHFSDIERLVMVGDKKWEQGMANLCRPFTAAKIRYFDASALGEARAWLESP